jgi:hypothetical protein
MAILTQSRLANALGRPDAVFGSRSASVGPPPTVVGGSAFSAVTDNSPVTGGGRASVIALMVLIAAYGGYTYWVRAHLR